MAKVAEDAARLALMELAEAFGADEAGALALLPVAMDGRLYLDGGKAVYRLARPVELANGAALDVLTIREPVAADYVSYSKGMSVTVKDGATEIDSVMMTRRTMRAVSALADQPIGVIDRLAVRDIRTLTEVCDALGFFE